MGADAPALARRIMVLTLSPVPSRRAPGIQVANMAQAFAEAGHHVEVVVPTVDRTLTGVDPATLLGFAPAFTVTPLARRVHRGQSVVNAVRIARLVRRTRPDLVLARDLRGCLVPALRGVPTLYEVHSLSTLRSRADRWVLRRLRGSRGYRGIVAISQALADDLVAAHAVDPGEVLVAHDGVRPDDEAPPETPDDDVAPLRVTYTGSLYPGKGADLLLPLAARCPWATFVIAGGPTDRADALRTTATTQDLANVDVVGPVDPAEARALQRRSDVLIAPFAARVESDSGVDISRWTSPLKVFEYMAAGRPMVVGDLPVLREVLRPGTDALLAPLDDVDGFVDALTRLRDDAALRRRLGAEARERALHSFTWRQRAAAVLAAGGVRTDEPSGAGTARHRATIVLASFGSGGAERVTLNLAGGLVHAGWAVRLVVIDARGPLRGEVPAGVTVVELGAQRVRTAFLALARTIRRDRPDLLLSTQTHVSLALLAMLPILRGWASDGRPRLVVRAPQLRRSTGPAAGTAPVRTREDRLERRLLPGADLVVASSPTMAATLRELVGPGGPPVVELPNPVAIDALRAAAHRGVATDEHTTIGGEGPERVGGVRLIVVGRLVPEKAHDDLLTALARADRTDLDVTMVGEGPLGEELTAMSTRLGLDGRVDWVGRIDDRDRLLGAVARADLLVLPSRTEGMPNAVLEALAVGTPVLATTDLPMLVELAEEVGPTALRLVPRSELPTVLGSIAPAAGPVPRPSLLPARFAVDAVVASLLDAVAVAPRRRGATPA